MRYRALRGCSCGSRGILEDRMMDIITGRAPPLLIFIWRIIHVYTGGFVGRVRLAFDFFFGGGRLGPTANRVALKGVRGSRGVLRPLNGYRRTPLE